MIFQNTGSIPSLDQISREFVQGLPGALADPYAANTTWTKTVTAHLDSMGRAQGLTVFCHGSEHREWLLDVVWMVQERHEIVLAVESEWGKLREIEDDFDKLLSIKAQRKLLLFSTKSHNGAEDILRQLESNMRAYPYHLTGEEYMALEVTAPGAYRYCFQVPSDGRLDAVSFTRNSEPLPWPWA